MVVRFIATPIETVNMRLSSEQRTVKMDLMNLDKRLHLFGDGVWE